MLKDDNLSIEEFLKRYTKEEVVSYIEELYSRHDNLEAMKMNFNVENNKKEKVDK